MSKEKPTPKLPCSDDQEAQLFAANMLKEIKDTLEQRQKGGNELSPSLQKNLKTLKRAFPKPEPKHPFLNRLITTTKYFGNSIRHFNI